MIRSPEEEANSVHDTFITAVHSRTARTGQKVIGLVPAGPVLARGGVLAFAGAKLALFVERVVTGQR